MSIVSTITQDANCNVTFGAVPPAGWTFAVARVRYAGSAHLLGTTKARIFTGLIFTGLPGQTADISVELLRGRYELANVYAPDQLVFIPCGTERFMHLNTVVTMEESPPVPSRFSAETARIQPDDLVWKKCRQ